MRNYGELKSTIARYLHRSDLDGDIPGFISLAEARIYRNLRTRENEFYVNLTDADIPINPITLPANFREIKLISVNDKPLRFITDQRHYSILAGEGQYSQTDQAQHHKESMTLNNEVQPTHLHRRNTIYH